MKGSYLAQVVDEEIKREKRRKEKYAKKDNFAKEYCFRCKNKTTDLCHITQNIKGKLKCINYEVEQNT